MAPEFEQKRMQTMRSVDALVLAPLTSDPPLVPGRLWLLSGLGLPYWTPDGSTKVLLAAKFLVSATWSDTTPYYTVNFAKTSGYSPYTAAVELDAPATGHKRVRETDGGGVDIQYHYALLKDALVGNRMYTLSYVGAYHGYNATRANLLYTITHRNNVNKTTRDDTVPWLRTLWSMSRLGYPNGSYGRPLEGSITFTSPPSYSFTPANPEVIYNRVTEIPSTPVWLLYGYLDLWALNYAQWASLQNTSVYWLAASTKPPEPEVVRELGVLAGFEAVIAKWDGEVRLHLRSGEKGLILPLGRNVEVAEVKRGRGSFSEDRYDRARKGAGRGERNRFIITVHLKTDKTDVNKLSDRWLLRLVEEEDGVTVVFGDTEWDGDKYGYYITGIT